MLRQARDDSSFHLGPRCVWRQAQRNDVERVYAGARQEGGNPPNGRVWVVQVKPRARSGIEASRTHIDNPTVIGRSTPGVDPGAGLRDLSCSHLEEDGVSGLSHAVILTPRSW